MTLAEMIIAQSRGVNEARSAALCRPGHTTSYNGMEIIILYEDNSALIIVGGLAVFAGKGQ